MAVLPEITQSQLISWGGAGVFNQALHQARKGAVLSADWNPATGEVSGRIALGNGGELRSSFKLRHDGAIISKCPCESNARYSLVCWHVVALGLDLMLRRTDPRRQENYEAEKRAAEKAAKVDPSLYLRRSESGTPVKVVVRRPPGFADAFWRDGAVTVSVRLADSSGAERPPEDFAGEAVRFSPEDEDVFSVLEDICAGPVPGEARIGAADLMDLLGLLCREKPVHVSLRCEMSEEDGSFAIYPWADIPGEEGRIRTADRFLAHGREGFVFSGGRFFPMADVLPEPFHSIYSHDEIVDREAVPAFLKTNLPLLRQHARVECIPSEDMFAFIPAQPVFRVKLNGSRASLSAELSAQYAGRVLPAIYNAREADVALPDPDDMLLFRTRNTAAEADAAGCLQRYGFDRDPGAGGGARFTMNEPRAVLNFLGQGYPELRRRGWHFDVSPRLTGVLDALPLLVPGATVRDAPRGMFDVKISFDAAGRNIPETEIQRAINRGDGFLHTSSGETLLIDSEAVKSMRSVFSDCKPTTAGAPRGHFRVSGVYAPYVRSSLEAFDGFDVEDSAAPDWREAAERRNGDTSARFEPVDLGKLENILRPYQKQGVYWMRFLEKSGLCGLLADEMGLGKTLQTLTWLSLARTAPDARDMPALVVCPTSLVENWAREAEKFVPWMKTLVVSGPDRAKSFADIPSADIVVTSYALLQRDIEDAYSDKRFSAIVLDEAQHIKNRRTRNAKAAKQLDGIQKLVLTGTPVENSVADVWSIFDFLMPDYLGDYETFKCDTEDPIAEGGEGARAAQEKLRRKLHPFILRRLKKDVAKDLPDKIIRIHYSPMTPSQQRAYNALLGEVRSKVGDMVKQKGFKKSRFEILALLMRLRQVSCHLGLLEEARRGEYGKFDPADASGKVDSFMELLDEAIDAGHRVLVFSQFVKMLSILREELEARGIKYCYLDGSTKNRLDECKRFNTSPDIPLFLISLHAGGTGLNLTGADMVVHFDPWWNPAVEDQATDRAHRIGQKKTVYVVKMIASGSVEERVLALQKKKQLVIQATIGTTDEAVLEQMSYEDIAGILDLPA